jgi:hypothetical protein
MSSNHASEPRGRLQRERGRSADAFVYTGIGLYAVTLYATLGYLVYTLVSSYLTARG